MKLNHLLRHWRLICILSLIYACSVMVVAGKTIFADELIPHFNIPRMTTPPKIDGSIDSAEWKQATKVMGMVSTYGLDYKDRPVSFWLSWDPQHLYLAYRVDTLTGDIPHLQRAYREKYATRVVFDDAIEVGLFLHDRNKKANEVSSYLKFVINSLGSGEYMKNYPDIGQVMFNWTPTFDIANRTYTDAAGKSWWEMEIAMDLEDVQMPVPHKAGDPVDIGLFADVKNPNWQWLDYPSASGHLEHFGFPRGILTEDQPYIQVEEISGLHDEKLAYKSVIYNPTDKPVALDAKLLVQHGTKTKSSSGELADPADALNEVKTLEIPAKDSIRFDVAKDMPGLQSAAKGKGFLRIAVTPKDAPAAAPVYTFACNFSGKDKSYLKPGDYKPYLPTRIEFNPANGRLALAADTLDSPLPEGVKAAGATYRVSLGDKTISEGKLRYYVNQWYDDLVELGSLQPGKYVVTLALVDATGKELASAKGGFDKQDEAKVFAKWWDNKIGDTEKLLKPFEALKVQKGKRSKTAIACTRRVYEIGSLGLPVQIQSNGGPLLTAPAHLVVKVSGKEYIVPTNKTLNIIDKKDWRVDFTCPQFTVAGITFSGTGKMEQDGLVELALTYAPSKKNTPVNIEELRIEWPIDDSPGLYMSCTGQGGNYSARTIGKVPDGKGQVWNTRDDIGVTGSGRKIGNFLGNLWVGTEQRGLFWGADSDNGWEPDAKVPAHLLRRDGKSVVIVNNLIGSVDGKAPFKLTDARTVHFGYNASPFKNLTPGFRVNSMSACGSFSGGKYKVNWDNKQEFFTVLSPPFSDTARWPEYYAYCKDMVKKMMYDGINFRDESSPGSSAYYANSRYQFFTANQVALRGYGYKSIENPNPYNTFAGDWVGSEGYETLSKSYRDYMIWLMDRQVKEGGCQHFYFDISFAEKLFSQLAAGIGYRLSDGSIQPESTDVNLREWYKRVQAMMQENNLYPGSVSGHATHGFSMKMLPFTDCILDSEYPMADSIDVYTSESMIALSCPHTFGTNIQHHGNFMNPTWPMMHDASGGDFRGPVLGYPEFKQWGMTRTDVEFIPYWRNKTIVKDITPGLITSMWKRPGKSGSVIIAVMNHGIDPKEPTRSANIKLDLKALGIPTDALATGGDRVRIRQFTNLKVQNYYLRSLKWMEELKGKTLPPIEPKLDLATGIISGFDINYHDVKLLVIDWEEKPVDDAALKTIATDEKIKQNALIWGINGAVKMAETDGAKLVQSDNSSVKIELWKRTGDQGGRGNSVLIRVYNISEKPVTGTIKLDLKGLEVNVRKVWAEFTNVVPQDGKGSAIVVERADQPRNNNQLVFNAYAGEIYYNLSKGQSRVFSIDRY